MGAKFTTTEVVSSVSALEAEVRCKLTWQELDHRLWLASLSPLAALSAEKVVVDPQSFVPKRPDLVLGFSDQVPLWAKAAGRKAAFAQPELQLPQRTADFSEVRQHLLRSCINLKKLTWLFESFGTPLKANSAASLASSAGSKTPQLAKSSQH